MANENFWRINMKKKLIILFVFCCCLIIASKGSENGYLELAKMDDEIIKHIDKKGYWCTSQIEKKLNSLLNLSISKTEIWGHNLNIKGIPSFRMFLRPKIKNNVKSIPNPYFGYALFTFLSSKRFKEGESKLQQETCLQLLGYYLSISDNLKCYNVYHKKIIQLLFIKCHDKKYYNDKSLEIIKETIVKNKIPSKRYLLLLWIINEKLDSKIKKALMRLADNCNDFDKKDLTPWFALIFLAKNGEKKYLDQLINTQVLQFKFERKNEQLNLEKQPLTCYISISYNKLKI